MVLFTKVKKTKTFLNCVFLNFERLKKTLEDTNPTFVLKKLLYIYRHTKQLILLLDIANWYFLPYYFIVLP